MSASSSSSALRRGFRSSAGTSATTATATAAAAASGNAPGTAGTTAVSPNSDSTVSSSAVSHDAYDVVKVDDVTEYGARATLFRHKKTGAEVLSVEKDDENKVFGIVFRTPPTDSTGIPHILEHSVLCGSRKYTVKEPFTELMKSSLNTFLNAFTYPDRTCYPVASQNLKDFYNLVNVYLDAVFFPRAVTDPQVMAQEGWHYELDKEDDPLTRKGVVFNEMKGVYSQPDNIMGKVEMEALFPDNTYGVDSGGDPQVIPSLTFEQFKSFHQANYHPSNARVYFYGDDPVKERLDLLDSYLSEFEENKVDTTVGWQPLLKEPRKISGKFPSNSEEGKYMASVNWVVHDSPLKSEDKLAISILSHLLMGTSASVLRKALTDSGLGEQVLGGGFDDTLQQTVFNVGLKGLKGDEDAEKVENLVIDILSKLKDEGFPEKAVAASINTIEFRLREFNTGGFPKGLMLMLGALEEWIYGGDPLNGMRFEKDLASLKQRLKDGEPVFQNIIKSMLIDNTHRVTVSMAPDTQLEAKDQEEERKELDGIKSSMSADDVKKIVEETKLLKEAQAAEDPPEAVATMPTLSLSDLDKKQRDIPIKVEDHKEGTKLVTHALSTSGIMYLDMALNLQALPMEDLPLIPLFERLLTEAGTQGKDAVALSQYIGTHTGGLGVSHFISQKANGAAVGDPSSVLGYLTLRAKCVPEKVDTMLDIAEEVLTTAKLDNRQRAIEILKETKAGLEAAIVGSGHRYAAGRLSSRFTVADHIGEKMGGLDYLATVKEMLEQAENDDTWPALQKRLEGIRSALLCTKGDKRMIINLTADQELLDSSRSQIDKFVDRMHGNSIGDASATKLHDWAEEAKMEAAENEGFPVPTQVNYVGFGGQLFKSGEEMSGSAQVISKFLSTGFLWDQVRVIGGAYGGFCGIDPVSGLFRFLSYRDPNLQGTVDNYKAAADFLANIELTQEELEKAVIGTIGDIDSPTSPDQKGFTSLTRWLVGREHADLQRRRDQILGTTVNDFKEFGKRLQQLNTEAKAVVIGSGQAFEEAKDINFNLKNVL
eukprot:jgi/Bigna1/54816/estExt_Genewise1Plus.C_440058